MKLKTEPSNLSENRSSVNSKRPRGFIFIRISLGLFGLLAVLALTSPVYADGGVGGGGTGNKGCQQPSWPCTTNGEGWATYTTTGSGPTRGFRDSTIRWSSAQTTCRGIAKVAVFVINNSYGQSEGYNYKPGFDTSNFLSSPAPPTRPDNGATPISTGTAKSVYDSLPASLKAGYTWGYNVAWFCYGSASPSKSYLDGYKVSTSGSPSGPFSDDAVTVSGDGSSTSQPFWFDDGSGHNASFSAGTHTVSISAAGTPDGDWQVVGYRICKGLSVSQLGNCTGTALLANPPPAFVTSGSGSSFSFYFAAGGHYHMRWIFKEQPPAPPPITCPALPGVNVAAVPASFGAGNNGQVTGNTNPAAGNTYQIRTATSYHIVSATDAYTGANLPVNTTNNTVDFTSSVKGYPYDPNRANVTYYDNYNIAQYTYSVDKNGVGSWKLTGSGSNWVSGTFTDGSASIGDCYHRRFSATMGPVSGSLQPTSEDPTSASFGTTVTVKFEPDPSNPPYVGLRNSNAVTLNTSVQPTSNDSACTIAGLSFSYPVFGQASPQTLQASCKTGAPPLAPGDTACAELTASPEQGQIDSSGGQSGTSGSVSQSGCTGQLTNEPYAHFFINGVAAGGAFDSNNNQCADVDASSPGSIKANTDVDNSGYPLRGSGAQFGAIASGSDAMGNSVAGSILDFLTASLRGGTPPSAPYGLEFANNPSGNSLGTSRCVPGYLRDSSDVSSDPRYRGAWSGNFQKDGSGNYYKEQVFSFAGGNLSVPKVPDGVNAVIYASSDVTISGDIEYQADSWSINSGSINLTNVPSLYVITNGNINIGSGVNELDGVYVAQGGTIDTCYTHSFADCDKQLIVYGSFVANKINLYRTFASLRDSASREHPGLPPQSVTDKSGGQCAQGDDGNPTGTNSGRSGGTGYDCAAELFIFSPANYLSRPALPAVGGPGTGKFDAISSLSPVL